MIDLAAETLRRTGRLRLRAQGSSMLPAICPGDVLRVKRVVLDRVECGDVVLYQRDGRFFAHRVVGRRPGTLVTRGDALDRDDEAIDARHYLGRVEALERGRGRLVAPRLTGARLAAARLFSHSGLATRAFLRWCAWRAA